MTDHSNSDHQSTPKNEDNMQTEDKNSSETGRAYGWSEPKDSDSEGGDRSASGSAAGDVGENQQRQDDGLASDAMGAGSGSDLMKSYDANENHDATNDGIIGGR